MNMEKEMEVHVLLWVGVLMKMDMEVHVVLCGVVWLELVDVRMKMMMQIMMQMEVASSP